MNGDTPAEVGVIMNGDTPAEVGVIMNGDTPAEVGVFQGDRNVPDRYGFEVTQFLIPNS
ncbi:MAG: hypothetical protein M1130_13530 [Actinobacteria bacterium]|nr:hypothetical protein [Actinomycetota bacterium]